MEPVSSLPFVFSSLTTFADVVRVLSPCWQCRTSFAQRMMRLELLADSFNMEVNVGENKGEGNFTYDFRSMDGGGSASDGADDPFSNPDGGPLSRIELKLEKLEGELTAMRNERKAESTLRALAVRAPAAERKSSGSPTLEEVALP